MSLFKTRDLWSTNCDNDLFDLGCLRVANLGVNKKNFTSIITGSYNGFLRVYNPSKESGGGGEARAHDLICELSLPNPIIQIETGRFVSTSSKQHIAVLLPRKLMIYECVVIEGGSVEHGNQYSLKFVYEHVLQRSSYNMCKGAFGGHNASSGAEPHEYLCVQSMDGMLSVFEYESFSLGCYLPKVLIPGPFKYVPKTDSFVTVSSTWELESYRYQTLASSAKTYERSQDSNTVKLKKILPEYTFNLGEPVLDIEVITHTSTPAQTSILVLGERNLFCMSETCVFKYMKKFDYNPSSFCAYGNNNNNSINFIVASHSKVLFVHEDVRVKWAAQVEHVPVQVVVARINDLNGVVVSLSENGKLKCSYLGTEPAFNNIFGKDDAVAIRPFNFDTADAEYRTLQTKIKSAIMSTGSIVKTSQTTGLILIVDVPNKLDPPTQFGRVKDTELKDPIDSIPSITCKILIKSAEGAQNVKLSISCSEPLVAVPDSVFYSSIGSVPFETEVCFYMRTRHIPYNLIATVCATYCQSLNGATKIAENKFRLPLKLVLKPGAAQQQQQKTDEDNKLNTEPNKTSLKKIVLDSNRACPSLVELFPELAGTYSSTNSLSAQVYGHPNAHIQIQTAKSGSNRYRIQADSHDYMWLLVQELVVRLNSFHSKQPCEISYNDPLPTDDFKQCIEKHLELRQTLDKHKEILEQYCVQFRAIQKRLLMKFKDKSPTSLDNLDALLEATFRQISLVSEAYLSTQRELSLVTSSLNCMSSLYVMLISVAFRFSKESAEVLEAVMGTPVVDTAELGWEEIVNAAVANLLKTTLSKAKTEQQQQQQPQLLQSLKLPSDASKIEKQLKSMVAKLESGASLFPVKKREEAVPVAAATVEKSKPNEVEVKKPSAAPRSHATMGEDYEAEIHSEETQRRPTFGSKKLPTFDELMAAKNKPFNYNLDEE